MYSYSSIAEDGPCNIVHVYIYIHVHGCGYRVVIYLFVNVHL